MPPSLPRSTVARLLTIACGVLMLTGCGGSTRLDARPVEELRSALAAPPPALIAPCFDPILLPDGPLNAGPAIRYWAIDRASLASCKQSKADSLAFYAARDAGLAGGNGDKP